MRVFYRMTIALSAVLQLASGSTTALAQGLSLPLANTAPPPTIQYDAPPVMPQIPPPRIPIIPVIPVIPVRPETSVNIPFMPLDVIQPMDRTEAPMSREKPDALRGIAEAKGPLPTPEPASNADGILVRFKPGSKFEKTSLCSLALESGAVLVSVRRPSKVALVATKLAEASFSADSDVEVICEEEGTERIINLSGLNQSVQVKLSADVLSGPAKIYTVMPGHELVIADHKLHRAELRPADGYARRFFKVLDNGKIAISEISVESVLKKSDLIASINQSQSNKREQRMLGDMSKMAAVLNYMNGSTGFDAEPKASLAVNSEMRSSDK